MKCAIMAAKYESRGIYLIEIHQTITAPVPQKRKGEADRQRKKKMPQ